MLQEYLGLSMCINQKGRGSSYAGLCLMLIKTKPRLGNELRVAEIPATTPTEVRLL